VAFVLVAIAAAGAVGIATWQMLTGRPIGAGLGALAAGAILLAADPMMLGPGAMLERTVASYVDRAYDGAILAAIAPSATSAPTAIKGSVAHRSVTAWARARSPGGSATD